MTQQDEILAHLKTGRSLTPYEALELYGCTRLGAVIHTLKKKYSHSINTHKEKKNGKTYARYRMAI